MRFNDAIRCLGGPLHLASILYEEHQGSDLKNPDVCLKLAQESWHRSIEDIKQSLLNAVARHEKSILEYETKIVAETKCVDAIYRTINRISRVLTPAEELENLRLQVRDMYRLYGEILRDANLNDVAEMFKKFSDEAECPF